MQDRPPTFWVDPMHGRQVKFVPLPFETIWQILGGGGGGIEDS